MACSVMQKGAEWPGDPTFLFPATVPSASVVGVTLTYDVLKQEIVVAWTPLVTQPPEGEVAFYEVQYGRSNSSLSTFRAHPPYNSLYLDGIPDDDYQVNPLLPCSFHCQPCPLPHRQGCEQL